ncbi:MAG: sigma 54-interacting transcriptional regulator [Desulfosarcinaceae bacterium]|nr:sigma 54-interacting transcriptional regulator [Desulfosarcinaceae bacterium]
MCAGSADRTAPVGGAAAARVTRRNRSASGAQDAAASATSKDAAEHRNMAEAVHHYRKMARELDAIINSSSDGLFVCDAAGTVIRMNPASERIHQVSADAVIGRNLNDLLAEGFIDRSAALEALARKETVSLLQDKAGRKLISTATLVMDDAGQVISVVVSERDITQIDTLQRELEDQTAAGNQLRHQLREMQLDELGSRKIIARSPSVLNTLEQALKVSGVQSSVLITGESGVGKGLIANLIHNNSERAAKPLIRINCGAIPESLIESELFGYESGAFTGARSGGKPGHLELAHEGTLFLDEIAELPPAAQVKLLRFLEDGRLTRLGGSGERQVDARIIAATHRDLKAMVVAGDFREDLYYRLNVIPLQVPAVRDRSECILPLIRHYVAHFAGLNQTSKRLSRQALDALLNYPYPGNVRELMNICERAVVMSDTEVIDLADLPTDVVAAVSPPLLQGLQLHRGGSLAEMLALVERDLIRAAMAEHGSQEQAASALGVSQPTIARRLKKYGLR